MKRSTLVGLCALMITAAAGPALAQPAPQAQPPAAPRLEFAFEAIVYLEGASSPGKTAYGSRNIIPIIGGTVDGPALKGVVVPGGWDWQLVRADGCVDVKADYMLKTDDGVIINVVNTGALCMPKAGEAPKPVRTQPRFEAPLGKYEWMSQTAFIGTLDMAQAPGGKPAVRIRIYKAV